MGCIAQIAQAGSKERHVDRKAAESNNSNFKKPQKENEIRRYMNETKRSSVTEAT